MFDVTYFMLFFLSSIQLSYKYSKMRFVFCFFWISFEMRATCSLCTPSTMYLRFRLSIQVVFVATFGDLQPRKCTTEKKKIVFQQAKTNWTDADQHEHWTIIVLSSLFLYFSTNPLLTDFYAIRKQRKGKKRITT